jgi:site-specific recombinase XerD
MTIECPLNNFEVIQSTDLVERAKDFANNSRAKNTKRAYSSDWRHFENWCRVQGAVPLPADPALVALYITALAERLKTSTLQRKLTAITQAHQVAGYQLDTKHVALRETWSGIKRTLGTAQQGKAPVLVSDLRELVSILPENLSGVRDRALLLLGFSGAFRRSELVSLNVEDLCFSEEGLTILQHRSKVDQEGQGRKIGIPYGSNLDTCPVRNTQKWIKQSNISCGSLFVSINRHGRIGKRLSDKSVALIIKKYVYELSIYKGASHEEASVHASKFAGHSLRAGLATSAAMAGVSEISIARQTGHKKLDTLRKYIRMGSLFKDNAAAKLGL